MPYTDQITNIFANVRSKSGVTVYYKNLVNLSVDFDVGEIISYPLKAKCAGRPGIRQDPYPARPVSGTTRILCDPYPARPLSGTTLIRHDPYPWYL